MDNISLLDAVSYYDCLPHQTEAFEYLQAHTAEPILHEFAKLYRNESESKAVKEKPDFIAFLLKHCEKIGIFLDIPSFSSDPEKDFCINIIGIKGLNPDFTLNNNLPNHFNDLIIILKVNKFREFKLCQVAVGSVEPGDFYTYDPLNPEGVARVISNTKHEKIWRVGTHGVGKSAHEALVQTGQQICVARDKNKDFSPIGDRIHCGNFGINLHWGYDLPLSKVGKASAGCIVVREKSEHQTLMKLVKEDCFYLQDKQRLFSFILLDGDKI